jgi:hypothetical protein
MIGTTERLGKAGSREEKQRLVEARAGNSAKGCALY